MANVVLDRTDVNELLSACSGCKKELQVEELAETFIDSFGNHISMDMAEQWAEVVVENKERFLRVLNW